MRVAFKDWAIVVDALGRGEQILVLRKGGIHESKGGFQLQHPKFLLFPTRFHQQRESVIPSAQNSFDEIASGFPDPGEVRLEYFAEVMATERLDSLAAARRLEGQHIWKEEVIAERFEWGKEKGIYALALRVFQLPERVNLPMNPSYGGCKSWIALDREIPISGSEPVLPERDFAMRLKHFKEALELVRTET